MSQAFAPELSLNHVGTTLGARTQSNQEALMLNGSAITQRLHDNGKDEDNNNSNLLSTKRHRSMHRIATKTFGLKRGTMANSTLKGAVRKLEDSALHPYGV